MSKTSGLGDNFYYGGYDLSGDINSLSSISGSMAPIDVTGINKFAFERIGGMRDGKVEFTSYFNVDSVTFLGAHNVFSALPTSDEVMTYARGTTLGNDAACMVAKQLNYDGTRGTDGSVTFAVGTQANGYGLEWGVQLTAGLRTDTVATTGTGVDTAASASFGGQAYLQVTAFTGTDVTVKIQDSADNVTFADVTSFAFAQTTAAHTTQRIALGNTATIRRYVRATTVTSGGFSSATFSVVMVKNASAGIVF